MIKVITVLTREMPVKTIVFLLLLLLPGLSVQAGPDTGQDPDDEAVMDETEDYDDKLEEIITQRLEWQEQLSDRLSEAAERQISDLLEGEGISDVLPADSAADDERLSQLWDIADRLDEWEADALPDQEIAVMTAEQLQQARQLGVTVLDEQPLPALGGILVTFAPLPDGVEIEVVPNHLYQLDAAEEGTAGPLPVSASALLDMVGLTGAQPAQQRIGMMDSAIDRGHPCLQGVSITQKTFIRTDSTADTRHGTALASVMAGRAGCGAEGILQQASLVNAVVFARTQQGPVIASASQLVTGLDWLLQQQVRLVNLSLSGPPNPVLERALNLAHRMGVQLVASVGNDGTAAFPRYPAAYDAVIAVTAVDRQRQVFPRAVRGPHVELSAPGIGLAVAAEQGQTERMSGTSLAAAFTTAVLATHMPAADMEQQRRQLQQEALDLGEPGRDPVFGFGLLQVHSAAQPQEQGPAG